MLRTILKQNILLIFLFFVFILSFIAFYFSKLDDIYVLLTQSLIDSDLIILENAIKRSQSLILTFSELHASILVLQSVELSIDFIVDASVVFGNVLNQLSSIISLGKNTILVSLVALKFINGAINIVFIFSPILIILCQFSLIVLLAIRQYNLSCRFTKMCKNISTITLSMTLSLLIALPLAIKVVDIAGHAVFNHLFENNYKEIVNTHKEITGATTSVQGDSFKTSLIVKELHWLKSKLEAKTKNLANHISSYMAFVIIEVFLIPVFVFSFFYYLIRYSIYHKKNN